MGRGKKALSGIRAFTTSAAETTPAAPVWGRNRIPSGILVEGVLAATAGVPNGGCAGALGVFLGMTAG